MIIPRILHQIWLGGPIPDRLQEYMDTWKKKMPRWKYMLWNEDNLFKLQNQELFDNALTYAEKSDIARYEILRKFGGVYSDCDIECRRKIEMVIRNADFFITKDKDIWSRNSPKYQIPYLNNALMGCVPCHHLINRLVDTLPVFYEEHKDFHLVMRTGPGYVSLMLNGENILVPPKRTFNREYCRHHYFNSWKKDEGQPEGWWEM